MRVLLATAVIAATALAAPTAAGPGDATWTPTLPLAPQGRISVARFSEGEGYELRSDNGSNGPLFRTTDYGLTWTADPEPVPLDSDGLIKFGSPKTGYAMSGSMLLKTQDAAHTWRQLQVPTPAGYPMHQLDALETADHGRTVVVAVRGLQVKNGCVEPQPGYVLQVSRDGGATWRPLHSTTRTRASVFRLAVHDADHIVAIVGRQTPDPGGQCQSSGFLGDTVEATAAVTGSPVAGNALAHVADAPDNSFISTSMQGPHSFVVGTSAGNVLRSTDGGRSFVASHVAGPASDAIAGAGAVDNALWVTGIDFAGSRVGYLSTNSRGTWRSTDGGATWTAETSPVQQGFGLAIADIAVADADHAIAGGPNSVLTRLPG
jgi:photosystem II stability/assembly factor-like uncharacterized protein